MDPINVHEFEAVAKALLSPMAYDYYAGGSDDEVTLAENREAFRRRHVRFRVLHDVSHRDLSTSVLGIDLPHPIMLAPTAMQMMAHPDGERATAKGAAASGSLHTVSTIATVRLEDVMDAAPANPKWFQLYCYADRDVTAALAKRAYAAGYKALVLTVDTPLLGRRERDIRNAFTLPDGMTFANLELTTPPAAEGESMLASVVARMMQTDKLTWEEVDWLQSLTPMPLILKGIVRADDAEKALARGVEGIWVSNHGGRQLDGSVPTMDALAEVAPVVKGKAALILDGGVRRGTDVLKALALGADAVAIGRPQLWGLAAGGADGVGRVVDLLRDELSLAMALAGCPDIASVTPDLLR